MLYKSYLEKHVAYKSEQYEFSHMLILLLSQYYGQRHLVEILSLESKTNMCFILFHVEYK